MDRAVVVTMDPTDGVDPIWELVESTDRDRLVPAPGHQVRHVRPNDSSPAAGVDDGTTVDDLDDADTS